MKFLSQSVIVLIIVMFTFGPISKSFASDKIVGSIAVNKHNKSSYPDLAKITLQDAIKIVSKDHPGKILEVALEREDGYLVYEVELITDQKVRKEIILDAGNGKILEVKTKNKNK